MIGNRYSIYYCGLPIYGFTTDNFLYNSYNDSMPLPSWTIYHMSPVITISASAGGGSLLELRNSVYASLKRSRIGAKVVP